MVCISNEGNLDYLNVLKSLQELPFDVGKKLLVEFMLGLNSHPSIKKNKLSNLTFYGCLAYSKSEAEILVDRLMLNGFIKQVSMPGNKFAKLLTLSIKGEKEIINPKFYKSKIAVINKEKETIITDIERNMFDAFGDFLNTYNDEQKKAIICSNDKILCIAGAGSGKTTVLTKRIEYLVKYKSIDPSKILAITFTRKARQEMIHRIEGYGGLQGISIETFNSFCEKILKKYSNIIYNREVKVITYRDKIQMVMKALEMQNKSIASAVSVYFSVAQKRGKTKEQLANIFMNDCFFVRDYAKFKNKSVRELTSESINDLDTAHVNSAHMVFGVCSYIDSYMKKNGLRDFADQLIDAIALFKKTPDLIPEFSHVLVDEYQDVNGTQIELINILNSPNLFCVGDPRQSIYGWRGSDISFILSFDTLYAKAQVISLKKNYRSTDSIVKLINLAIKNLKLPDLESQSDLKGKLELLKFKSENDEFNYVISEIIKSKTSRGEIFVLARTNRQLTEFAEKLKKKKIAYVLRSDEIRKTQHSDSTQITLATVHAIKGLEAKDVYLIGATGLNFPCKGSEHPVIDMVKVDEYDKEEEERRLFYVAMSRAKNRLTITYTGYKPTYFITSDMNNILGNKKNSNIVSSSAEFFDEFDAIPSKIVVSKSNTLGHVITRLKDWRKALSREVYMPAYIIMTDKTLEEIAIKKPTCESDLQSINGLGPTKIMKYGQDILDIVAGK